MPNARLYVAQQAFRVGHAALATPGVEPGEGEAVDRRRGPGERHVHDPDPTTARGEAIPDRRSPPEAAVYELEVVPVLASLGEVPDADGGPH